MKKIIAMALVLVLMVALFAAVAGCSNMQVIDTTYKFDRAIIALPDGTIVEGAVQSWRDYEDSDQIQVKIDGVTYLVFASNVVLISY